MFYVAKVWLWLSSGRSCITLSTLYTSTLFLFSGVYVSPAIFIYICRWPTEKNYIQAAATIRPDPALESAPVASNVKCKLDTNNTMNHSVNLHHMRHKAQLSSYRFLRNVWLIQEKITLKIDKHTQFSRHCDSQKYLLFTLCEMTPPSHA